MTEDKEFDQGTSIRFSIHFAAIFRVFFLLAILLTTVIAFLFLKDRSFSFAEVILGILQIIRRYF